MRKYYFDAARYKTYLEQLGVAYRRCAKSPEPVRRPKSR